MARAERVVFLDVGNVLIDDDPFLCEVFRLLYQTLPTESPKARPERFWVDLERALRVRGHQAIEYLGFRYHGRQWPKVRKKIQRDMAEQWWALARMIPQVPATLQSLRESYRLGIIANQPSHVVERLNGWGLLPLFDMVLLDSHYGVGKPDASLFRLALEQARVDPYDSVMVGDRLDNDVVPARRLGMRAVLIWLNVLEKGWEPEGEWGRTFWEVLKRLPVPRWDDILPKERPMALVRRWEQMPDTLEKVWAISI
jgi:HAD superfamily hydrolase (TIGR01549 family)